MRVREMLIATVVVVALCALIPDSAAAAPIKQCNPRLIDCWEVSETANPKRSSTSDSKKVRSGNDNGLANADDAWENEVREAKAAWERKWAAYQEADREFRDCNRTFTIAAGRTPYSCGSRPEPPDIGEPLVRQIAFAQPRITPAQAGAIAVARLKLPTVAPGIGPSPELNRWKMAAVGYPLWLWADGPTQVGPVSDSAGGLNVSLEAKVTKVTFRMGDGQSVSCTGGGREWTRAVKPGTKSPSCGYAYTRPSLPKGKYTVAAISNWAVTWTSNNQSGVIDVPAVDTVQLPVGELQVLVR